MTTIDQDFTGNGRCLLDLLCRQIDNREDLTGVHKTLPVQLVVRESTAPPPEAPR